MARAQFDRDEVVDKSIDLFWENGFSASSMKDVEEATGLKPGSIYLAFGNKEGLFKEALVRYSRRRLAKMRDVLSNAKSIGEGICTILEGAVEESTQENYCSCFLIKTRLELAAERNDLYQFASSKLGDVEYLFESFLKKEFNDKVAKRRATNIMIHIFGVRVYGYQDGSAERMLEGLKEGLPWLPWR
ncbi:TetR/AcrR family transcriptional regulator [Desulforhopalus sp. 52FAK]